MVAFGFMAGRESVVKRRRAIGPKEEEEEAEAEVKEKVKGERERRRGELSDLDTGAIFPWNELYASRGSQCIIYRSAFHYFFVVYLRSGSRLETRFPASARLRSFILAVVRVSSNFSISCTSFLYKRNLENT